MKQYKIIIITAGILLVLISVFVLNKDTDSQIKIGAIMPQTGFGAYWGAPALKGIELAKRDLEEMYGIGNVEIYVEDSQSDAAKGVTAAQKLLSINKVDALYTEFSGVSSAVSPLAQQSNKILMYSTYNQKIADDNKNSIKTFLSFEDACENLAKYVNDSNKKFLIISSIGDTAPYCVSGLETIIPKNNIKVVEGFVGKDFRTLLLQNKDFGPDYIIPIMYEDGGYALLKQIDELNIEVEVFSNKQDIATEKNITELPVSATNRVIYFETPINKEFAEKIRKIYPEMTEDDLQAAANSYQSMIALGIGISECEEKTAQCVTEKIANKKDFTLTGYEKMEFKDRILRSDLIFGKIKNKIIQLD